MTEKVGLTESAYSEVLEKLKDRLLKYFEDFDNDLPSYIILKSIDTL